VDAPHAFTGAALDRAGDARRRDPRWLAAQRAHPGARVLRAGDGGLRIAGERLARDPLAALGAAAADALLLGLDEQGPLFVLDEDPPRAGTAPAIGGGAADAGQLTLREAAARLSQHEGGLAAYVGALLNWHRRHRFCANCGSATEVAEAGLVRRCPRCGVDHHPRTDPVVIMLVVDGDRVLLGRQASWPAGRYSALAGFVEPGEALEEAVAREVREEASVRVGAPRYVASQPWPFPSSLMLGFIVPWAGGEPAVGDQELQDARWFERAEVARAAADTSSDWGPAAPAVGPLKLPPRLAIARRLVERWLAP